MLEFPVTTWVDLFHLRGKQNMEGVFFPKKRTRQLWVLVHAAPGILVASAASQRGLLAGGSKVEIA